MSVPYKRRKAVSSKKLRGSNRATLRTRGRSARDDHTSFKILPSLITMPDRMATKMTTTYTRGNTSLIFTGNSGLQIGDLLYFVGNNIYSPGVLNASFSTTILPASGWASFNNFYGNWQVKACAIYVRMTAENGNGIPVELCLVPLSTYAYTNIAGTTWENFKRMPYSSKTTHIMGSSQVAGSGSMIFPQAKLKSYMRMEKLSGRPDYFSYGSTVGTNNQPPSSSDCVFALGFHHPESVASGLSYKLEIKMRFYVVWYNRRINQTAENVPTVESTFMPPASPVGATGCDDTFVRTTGLTGAC